MRVFVTGASGFVGSAIVQELISAGHQVTGLARSEASAHQLEAAGATVYRGDLEDLEGLRQGVANSDAVVHAGFIHDFTRFKEVCETDRKVIEAIGAELAGSDRPFIITSGTAIVSPGTLALEETIPSSQTTHHPRVASEEAADAVAALGVRASVVRLSPSVHGDGDHGFVPMLINTAREKGLSVYIDEGKNRWTGVHKFDAAKLYRLAMENAVAGKRFHAVAEEGIAFREIAEMIGKQLNLPVVSMSPEDAAAHFGFVAGFVSLDVPASSKATQDVLGWHPTHRSLLEDLENGTYFKA